MENLEKKLAICLVLALLIVVFIPFYWVREPARQEAATLRIKMESVQRGKNTFLAACSTCHGQQAQGLVGPSLIGKDVALIQQTVRNGRGLMPAFSSNQISSEDLEDISNFLSSISTSQPSSAPAPTPSVTASPSAPTSPIISPSALATSAAPAPPNTPPFGDLESAGKEMFQGKAGGIGCAVCHGVDAYGLIGPNIRGSSAEEIKEALKTVAVMNSLKLSDNDIQALAAYLEYLESQ